MERYSVVLIKPNGSESLIGKVDKMIDVPKLLEDDHIYLGTWLSPSVKVLRHGRGEIHIREELPDPLISATRQIAIGKEVIHELVVEYHDTLKSICIRDNTYTGYNCLFNDRINSDNIVFQTGSLTKLAAIVGKEIAYECFKYQEHIIEQQFRNMGGAVS